MADSEISVKIVADLEDMKKSLQEIQKATGTLKNVAGQDIDNVVGRLFVLKTGFDAVSSVIGRVGQTLKAVTIDMAILGERATQVENGFMRLAAQAGIAGEALKDAVTKAADGTIETTHLLQRSSELISVFGNEASKIPQIIELSRKVAQNFGLDAEDAFNKMSEAVRNGNTKTLKQYGILVNSEEAVRKFAAANGIASNSLNETGRAQAILNAVLETGNKRFNDTKLSTDTAINAMARLRNSWDDLIESMGRAANTNGSIINKVLETWTRSINGASTAIDAVFNKGATQATAQVELLKVRLSLLYADQADVQKGNPQGVISKWLFGDTSKNVDTEIELVKAKIAALQKESAKGDIFGPPTPTGGDAQATDIVNKKQLAENERKFQSEIAGIRMQAANNAVALADTQEEFDAAAQEKRIATQDAYLAKVQEVNANEVLTAQQKYQLLEEQRLIYTQNQQMLELQLEQERLAAMERELANTDNFYQQMALSAEINGRRASDAWKKSGGLGGAAVNAFSQQGIKALDAFGRGSMSASEAVKAAFFGALGQMASAQGQVLILQSIWPPNPVGLAAGGALVALGGLLSSMGGGGADIGAGGAGGGGGPQGQFGGPSTNEAKQTNRSVTINVEGNYFDSEQTKLSIVQAVRDSADANDYTVQRGNRR